MKKGLILEGGAMRGLFTCGVCDVLMENGVEFDGAVGVSAGAAFGCNYKSGQIGRAARYNIKYANDPRYCSFGNLIKTGNMFSEEFCYHTLPMELDVFDVESFKSSKMEFYTVAINCKTGEADYHKCTDGLGDDLLYMRASASLPLISRPVEVDGKVLLDGGIIDSVPLKFFEGLGYDKNIVILTQCREYVKEKASLLPLMKLSLRKYPKVYEAMARRHTVYNETVRYINEREAAGKVYVIRPEEPLPVKRMEREPEVLRNAYEIGRRIASSHLGEITEFLEKE